MAPRSARGDGPSTRNEPWWILGFATSLIAQAPAPTDSAGDGPAAESSSGETPLDPAAASSEAADSSTAAEGDAASEVPLDAALQEEALDPALLSELSSDYEDGPAVDAPSLRLYGFADLAYSMQIGKPSPIVTWYPTFAIGNLNLYLANDFGSNWRTLTEVRFLYLPHGQLDDPVVGFFNPDSQRIDTTTNDYADVNRPLRWGGIEIERAWIEYTVNHLLNIRAGQWLTPYGIWNVDHGSPTVIGVYRPYIIGEALFPERQTGLQVHGSVYAGETKIGYHVTLSNGRGPMDAYLDLDKNKALGARVYAQTDALLGKLTVGISGYRGNFTNRPDNPVRLDPTDGPVLNNVVTERYTELALAADLKWEPGNFLVQAEIISADRAYEDALRPPVLIALPGSPPGFISDLRRLGYYALLGYRLPWWNLMPFAVWQSYDNPLLVDVNEWQIGFNMRPVPEVVLKAEYINVDFPDTPGATIDYLTTQIAWAF